MNTYKVKKNDTSGQYTIKGDSIEVNDQGMLVIKDTNGNVNFMGLQSLWTATRVTNYPPD